MAAASPHKASPARVPTRWVAALCTACFLLGVCVVNRYWAVPELPDCPNKTSSDDSRAVSNQVSQTREVIMALDRTISDIEMRLAAARAARAMSQGVSPSDSGGDQGSMRPRMFFVMGIVTTFVNRKRRDSIRQTWMPQGEHLQRLERDKGIVIRFVIGRSANPSPDSEVERAIDAEDKQYNDLLRLNHVEGYGGLPFKVQMFLSTALSTWDADFYVKVDDDVHVNIDAPKIVSAITNIQHPSTWNMPLRMEGAGREPVRSVLRLEPHGHLQSGGEDGGGAPAMLGRPRGRFASTVLTTNGWHIPVLFPSCKLISHSSTVIMRGRDAGGSAGEKPQGRGALRRK